MMNIRRSVAPTPRGMPRFAPAPRGSVFVEFASGAAVVGGLAMIVAAFADPLHVAGNHVLTAIVTISRLFG